MGGLAVIAFAVLGLLFLLRSKNKNAQQPPAQAPMQQQQPMPPYNPNNTTPYQSVYEPKYAAGLAQQQPVPPTGQTYPSPPPHGQGFGTPPPGQFQNLALAPGYQPPGSTPDRNQDTSPAVSSATDNRQSANPSVPSPTQSLQQAQPVQMQPMIHESGGETVGVQSINPNHHGQMHELG